MTDATKFLFDLLEVGSDDCNSDSSDVQGGRYSRWSDPRYIASRHKVALMQEANKLNLKTFSDVSLKPINWIINEWIPRGEVTAQVGLPGDGKSTWACAIAACVSRGEALLHPSIEPNKRGHVLIVSNEDGIDTLTARLIAAGADMTRVHFLSTKEGENGESPFAFSNARDLNRLEGFNLLNEDNIGLIIIDPIYLVVDGDCSNNSKARKAYENLTKLAKQLDCGILGIAHTVKNPSGRDPLARIAGASALREVPRGIILSTIIKNGPTQNGGTHVLVHAKNSLGKTDGGFQYCLQAIDLPNPNGDQNAVIRTVKIAITGELFGSAEDILNEADRRKPVETVNKTQLAEEFLLTTLKDGPKLLIDIQELVDTANFSMATVKIAYNNLHITSNKRIGDGRYEWSLPDYPVDKPVPDE
ncbi:MAG: hypothetical protein BVN35_02075 [Proteobacteria bacterium ST_bin11]|nr:MAG: hypothetical protein BVN35_02075 [Proteobacteria bacterium ST_bin11]